jgi:hypothetical protein
MILETILGGLTGLIGNVVGGIFKYKEAKLKMESLKLQNDHEIAMVVAETNAMIEEAKANIKITQAQVEGAIDLKDADAYMQSLKEGNKTLFSNKWIDNLLNIDGYMFTWNSKEKKLSDGTIVPEKERKFLSWKLFTVPIASIISFLFGFTDFIRGMIRPTLTVYLCGVTTWVTLMAWKIMQASGTEITATQAMVIFQDTTSIVVYLTVSCVTWWFGDRRMAKSIMELKGADRTKMDDEIRI